ncbi:hypothetical protein L1887_20133 [Cichorium endivia]|nr:hypothetical protein L1887_20133 [Cichorium endivia]
MYPLIQGVIENPPQVLLGSLGLTQRSPPQILTSVSQLSLPPHACRDRSTVHCLRFAATTVHCLSPAAATPSPLPCRTRLRPLVCHGRSEQESGRSGSI